MGLTEMNAATEVVKALKPWLDSLLALIAIGLSLYGTFVARSARRRLTITEPEDGVVHQEWASISGIGARRRWRVLIGPTGGICRRE